MAEHYLNNAKSAEDAIDRAYRVLQGDSIHVDAEKQYEAYLSAMADLYTHPDPSVNFEIREESRFLFQSLNERAAALEPLALKKWQEESCNRADETDTTLS